MTKSAVIMMVAVTCMAGCTPSYRVHVNTYAETGEAISPTASIYLAGDPNASNPILRKQIEGKMADLLRGYGYRPAQTAEAAEYVLTYRAGSDSEKVLEYAPVGRPYGGHFGRWGLGYTTYIPYVDTVYMHWLRMRLFRADGRALAGDTLVWIGEALTGTDDPDLREAINYLLVGCLDYFGRDTEEWVTMKIQRDDPRIIELMGVQGPEAPVE